jgi:glycosyltransferase involved in cell wall biosynthesis
VRVLILHSRYLSGDVSGENRVVDDEARLLADAGHDVLVRLLEPAVDTVADRVATAAKSIWAGRTAASVTRLVRDRGVDVVHAHNLFPELSPAVLPAAKRGGAAVVMTLHNYRMMCLPATLLLDGEHCERCVGRVPWPGVRHACYRGSRAGSAVLATSLTLHRTRGSFDAVDRYLAVSGYVRDKHVRAGVPADRIVVKENFVPAARERAGAGETFLFLGRVAREKGLDTLLAAWRAAPDLPPLVVAGDGPDAAALARQAPEHVRFLGAVPAADVPELLASARAVLVPSRWQEPAVPRAALEAYAAGVGVIAAATGALPEGVDDASGVLVDMDDLGAWVAAARRLAADAESLRLGSGAKALWARRFAPDVALRAIEERYGEVRAGALSA